MSIERKIKKKGEIDEQFLEYLEVIFPNKTKNVLEVIRKGITKNIYSPSNRIVWCAAGEKGRHLVYPKLYCDCQDFYKNVIVKRKRLFCKHLMAQVICEVLGGFQINKYEDKEFGMFLKEIQSNF
ncbi:MAG: hypothetical protein EU544_02470 [Promethearchaeota archaeon]|nr:MAG: hypothetical protein EU544_02470 [Candidatus Lokiarchaeota archaeon]